MSKLELFDQNIHSDILLSATTYNASACYLYYIYNGRNAWHSTWINQYYKNNCIHFNFEDAKSSAEKQRTQGSVFYICQLPGIVFKSDVGCIIVTEINAHYPIGGYSPCAVSNEVPYGLTKIDNARDCYLIKGSPMLGVALSFDIESRFWRERPLLKNSVITLFSENSENRIELIDSTVRKPPKCWKSRSFGPDYHLGWNLVPSYREITIKAVNNIVRLANSFKNE